MTEAVKVKPDTRSNTKKKRTFPDGTKLSQYTKCKTWTNKRWAWEFLCRNQEFIIACDKVINGTDKERAAVARKFGLVKFKHYADLWSRNNVFPNFKDGAIKSWENLGNEDIEQSICIAPDQVIIRFKLSSKLDAVKTLYAQLKRAENTLKKRLAEYNKKFSKSSEGKEINKLRAGSFTEYLRILDMQANRINSAKKIAEYLYQIRPNSVQEMNIDSLTRSVKRKISYASKYPEELYRLISLKL